MNEIREQIIQSSKNGTFFEAIYQKDFRYGDKRILLSKEISSIHNEGIIDVIYEFRQLSKNSKVTNSFIIRKIFEEALPQLNAPVITVMDCIKHLSIETGSGMLFDSFLKFCEADHNRPSEVLQLAESTNDNWLDFISPAIIAGSTSQLLKYVNTAINLSSNINIDIKNRAIFSLGKINYDNNSALRNLALKALTKVTESEYDDRIFGTTLKSTFNLYLSDKTIESKILEIIKSTLFHRGDYVLYSVSEIFGFHTTDIPTTLLDILIEALQAANINKDALDNIDYGLQYLIKNEQEDKAIILVEYFLIHKNNFSILDFNSVIDNLYSEGKPLLNKLVTRWFLSKNISLCKAVMDIIIAGHENDIVLSADTEQLNSQHGGNRLFVTRKAIGWLFTKPISATSFIISLIDSSSDDEVERIIELLFHPLLISYAGKVKSYIEEILPNTSNRIQTALTNALTKLDNYHEGLIDSRDIPDLLPSQTHRETYSRLFNRQMSDSMKTAQQDSIFNLIASKSVLLYGRKSINYIHSSDEKMIRHEMTLQQYGHTIEYPRLEYMDPEGLDFMLRIFRVEGC